MKYVIYLRISTDKQARSGLGLEAQRQLCLQYIGSSSQLEHIEFIDKGFSGSLSLDKRPALLEAIAQLKKDDILLIAKRDRIGRDPIVNAMIERAIERKKARLVSASRDVKDDNDPSSVLMKRMVDAFSEYERLIIGARTKSAMAVKKNKNERIGCIPYGYMLAPDGIHLELNPSEQEVLALMKDLRRTLSFSQIAEELNEHQIFNRKGNRWYKSGIHRVINNGIRDVCLFSESPT